MEGTKFGRGLAGHEPVLCWCGLGEKIFNIFAMSGGERLAMVAV